ncbi:MAG: GntR family transcriptional regulator [Candidatus Hydrogenedentes bacterium]|nr:GntR family transcriptional regulator [Candidatus Hydrogenedentota bacterium]
MHLHITPGDGIPIYRQIITQIRYLVASGRLQPGDELPPIRTLAQQLLINPNTVARAYRDLESMGLLSSRQGSGTVVADRGSPLAREEKLRIINDRLDGLLAEASQLGLELDELQHLLQKRHKTFHGGAKT